MIRSSSLLLLLFNLAFTVGCGKSETGVRLIVSFDEANHIDQLKVTMAPMPADEVEPLTRLAPEEPAGEPLQSGLRLLAVAGAWAEREVAFEVSGLAQGTERARGTGQVLLRRNEFVDLAIELLAPGCVSTCPAGDSQCVGEATRTCVVGEDGCARWGAPQPCPQAAPFCSNGRCAAGCEDECATGEKRCVEGSGYQQCGDHDKDTCLDWGPVIGCAETDLCQAGECVPDCGGQPCTCSAGETQACADRGECQGGQRVCKQDGTYGPCSWTVGPTVETCDGKDNDCDGASDNNLTAPACDKQAGVCAGATKKCGGAAGWLSCGAAEYQAAAGADYEVVESRCDGKDNDCNGKTDEAPGCCQPSCSGKACGADDGCGHPCPSGSCTANAVCNLGKCTCEFDPCGAACCAVGEVCSASQTCCQQDCSGLQCGDDPVCGVSCGSCYGTETCQQGICKSTTLGWSPQPSAKLSTGLYFAVGGSGPSDVWVVGGYNSEGDATHFDGTSWQSRKPQSAQGLNAVWASSPTDAWVVGRAGTLLHHDGSSFASFTAQGQGTSWNGVWGSASSDVWAVGDGGAILHYDGQAWAPASSPTSADLRAIWGASATDIWAGGSQAMLHFDGSTWQPSGPATWTIWSLSGVASNRIWAGLTSGVGYYDGSSWSVVSGAPMFARAWAASPTDVWAGGSPHGAMHHYDGAKWSKTTDLCANTALNGIWGASATDVWVVCNLGVTRYH